MPKKTRKQKIRAEHRHSVFIPAVPAPSSTASVGKTLQRAYEFQASNPKKQELRTVQQHQELVAIRSDVTRTLILAAAALTIELIIYWQLRGFQ